MRKLRLALLGAGMLFILGGCPSYLTMQSTRTVEPGQLELSAAAGRFITAGGSGPLSQLTGVVGPTQLEGAARFGLVPNLDLGIRLRLADLGVSGGLKLRFLNLEGFQMAVAGEFGTSLWAPIFNAMSEAFLEDRGISVFLWWTDVALLGSVPIGSDYLAFFGGKFKLTNYSIDNVSNFFGGTGGSGSVGISSTQIQPGVVFGVDMMLKGGARILPELDVHYDTVSRAFIFQLGVSMAIGGQKKRHRPSEPALAPTPAPAPAPAPTSTPAPAPTSTPAPAEEGFVPPPPDPSPPADEFVPPPAARS
ncbi:MAG: hypothetical protein P1V51_24695 [Deltaproteobacteria bacterium]|nr:hypothetical protein [Deltaproteobacteria bacterium]